MAIQSSRRAIVIHCAWMLAALASSVSSQQTAAKPADAASSEFPVIMRQNITAGKTPVGSRVQAELVIATMASGTVVPRGAILTGEVIESEAKSKTEPSRLSIRIDSAQWRNGSATLKIYLTAWYYPEAAMTNQDLSYQPPDAANNKRTWNGQGTYPDPGNPISQQKFPGRDSGKDADNGPLTPASSISKHRTLLKHIESARSNDGIVTLSSSSQNIKIDRLTTYVLATSDLLPSN
jgi:hypothetical protein